MAKKRFNHVHMAILAMLLSCMGLVSVGFASWIISQGDQATTSGTIGADDVNTNINGVSVTVGSVFEIGHYHFKNGNDYLNQNTGVLTYNISYDVSEIDKSILTDNNLVLSCSLSFGDGLAIFKSTYINSIIYNSNAITPTYISGNTAMEFTITQAIGNSDINNVPLTFTFNNKLVAKYGADMADGSFYLRLEAM